MKVMFRNGAALALLGGLVSTVGSRGSSVLAADGVPPVSVPSEYRQLAGAMSNAYGTGTKRTAPETADLVEIMARLERARNPAVRSAVERLQAGRTDAVSAIQKVQDGADAARRGQERVYEDAASGAYSRKYVREQVLVNSDGSTRTVQTTETVDESGLPVFGATLLNSWVQAHAPERMRQRAVAVMEGARLDAWGGLAARLGEVYPSAPTRSKAVEFRVLPPDALAKREGQFTAVNATGRRLTDATLLVDIVHFTTAPEPTTFQAYFVPVWEANAAIRLPIAVVRNRTTREFDLGRPVIANPAGDHPEMRSSDKRPWLAGAGGVVAVNATLWSAELRQGPEAFPFPDQAEEGARWDLGHAMRMCRHLLAPRVVKGKGPVRGNAANAPEAPNKIPEQLWEARAARRVIAFAPPGSDTIRLARLLLEDPRAAVREWDERATAATAKLTGAGALYEGEWKLEVKGFGLGVPEDVQRAVGARNGATGRVALRIDGQNDGTGAVEATLYDPDRPETKRARTGQLAAASGWLRFAPTFVARKGPAFAPEHLNPIQSPGAILLSIDGSGFVGSADGYPFPKCYEFTLNLKKVSVVGVPRPEPMGPGAASVPRPEPTGPKPASGPGGGAVPADAFQKGSVWRGRLTQGAVKFNITLKVLAREGEKFEARYEGGFKPRLVNGRIRDGQIDWSADDVKVEKGGTGENAEGKLTGNRVNLTFRDPTVRGAAGSASVNLELVGKK